MSERHELAPGVWAVGDELHVDLDVLRAEAGVPADVPDEELLPLCREALVHFYGDAGHAIPIEWEDEFGRGLGEIDGGGE